MFLLFLAILTNVNHCYLTWDRWRLSTNEYSTYRQNKKLEIFDHLLLRSMRPHVGRSSQSSCWGSSGSLPVRPPASPSNPSISIHGVGSVPYVPYNVRNTVLYIRHSLDLLIAASFLLIQRCKGTTDGLGYLEVLNCPCKFFSLGSWLVSALSTPNGGEGYNSSTNLNPNTITSIQLQCIQAASPHLADITTSKPQLKYCIYKSSPYQPPYWTCIWNKYPKRVALATKSLDLLKKQRVLIKKLIIAPGDQWSEIVNGESKIFSTEPTRTAKAGQKSLVPARWAINQSRKDLFHMFSLSPHLPKFQQSAGATSL